jgi:hypothetical protein
MSDYKTTVNIFVHLLKTQPSLFSGDERTALIELIDSQTDDIESLSNAISDWLLKHREVDDALAELEEIEKVLAKLKLNPINRRKLIIPIEKFLAATIPDSKACFQKALCTIIITRTKLLKAHKAAKSKRLSTLNMQISEATKINNLIKKPLYSVSPRIYLTEYAVTTSPTMITRELITKLNEST